MTSKRVIEKNYNSLEKMGIEWIDPWEKPLHNIFAGPCQVIGGPAWLHRPAEHLRLQVLLHGPEPGRGGEALVHVYYLYHKHMLYSTVYPQKST